MDSNNNEKPIAITDRDLADFVASHRQTPPSASRLPMPPLLTTPPDVLAARQERAAKRVEERRVAELRERFADLVRNAGLRYMPCTLENFRCETASQKSVLANVLAYVAADCRDNLVLYGPVGTGKDHIAFGVCREAIAAGKTVRWLNGQSWFGRLRDAIDTATSEASIISDLSRPELLCLSDPLPPVGALTQYQATMLYRLVDSRYSRGVPTIVTVNIHNDADADARMGEATWDRLCHGAFKLRCQWATFRKPMREM